MINRRHFLRSALATAIATVAGCQKSTIPQATSSPPTPKNPASPVDTPEKALELILHNSRPLDLETPVEAFDTFLTPNEMFFVRSHHPEPKLAESDWSLVVKSEGADLKTFTLEELKKFKKSSVTAVLQCSGNSRRFYQPTVPGVQWERGAAGNAKWGGVRLVDVLRQCGLDEKSPKHVILQGADKPMMATTPSFIRQLPLEKCLNPDTLLAYEMNDEPLPRLHGGPVRLVVPGWVGDDWMKWLTSITVQAEETEEFYFHKAYRYPNKPGVPGEAVPIEQTHPMTDMVVKSLFSRPSQSAVVTTPEVEVKGVAWTGGDRTVTRVDISDDGGKTWGEAQLLGDDMPYAWRLWSYLWKPKADGPVVLRSRATDSAGEVQPDDLSPWNPGGYLWNAQDLLELEVKTS